MNLWTQKLDAYLHDPPEKVLDLAWHKQRAEDYGHTGDAFHRPCDHTAAAADRLPWPHWRFLESAFDGRDNHFKHPLGGASFKISPYSDADIAHHFASLNRPQLTEGDDQAWFFAHWRLWRWWASDHKDSRLAFLPADTRIPDHTIWSHNSIVSALQACVVDDECRPAFLLFQIGPVQEYIAQARRTLDLWSGSYLLSYLVATGLKHIALNYGPDNVIYPNLCGQPIFDLLLKDDIWTKARVQLESSGSTQTLWDSFGYEMAKDGKPNDYGRRRLLTPSLPNRFLAVVPGGKDGTLARQIAEAVEKAIRDQFAAIATNVWKWASEKLPNATDWAAQEARFKGQHQRFLNVSWQTVPWPASPDEACALTKILPEAKEHEAGQGPRAGLWTILEMARRQPPGANTRTVPRGKDDHRDVRNFDCVKFPAGTVRNGRNVGGWKIRDQLQPDARLDNPGAAWSALYQLANWQLDAVRQTRAWQAWTEGGWQTGRDRNKDALNGKEEAILDFGGPAWTKEKVQALNDRVRIPNLFKSGELLGASTLIKRLWPSAHLASERVHPGADGKPLFKKGDFAIPDTRSIAASRPFDDTDEKRDIEQESEEASGPKYFAVLAFDGDEMGKWVSGLHKKMPKLKEQLSPGALEYFQRHLPALLERKRPLNPSFHLQFSEMLANFSNFCVRRIVEAHDGWLIYTGGDDVLALLPATKALDCARALRAAFRGEPETLNKLVGAWRGREKVSARLFDFEQPGFVRLHREAPKLEGEPGSFHATVPGPAADASVGIAIAHFKSPLQDVVRAAQDAEKRAKKQLGRSAVAVTLFKRSGETIEWGCQWDGGGLDIFDGVMKAMAHGAVSSKFPHRVVELLDGYLTETSPLAAKSLEPLKDFPVVDVALHEFRHALDRQGQNKKSDKYEKLVEFAREEPQEKALLNNYLARVKQEAEANLKKAREDGSKWSSLPPEERRRLEVGPVEAPIQALIGLCQTVAFIDRNRTSPDNSSSASSVVSTSEAERQPVS